MTNATAVFVMGLHVQPSIAPILCISPPGSMNHFAKTWVSLQTKVLNTLIHCCYLLEYSKLQINFSHIRQYRGHIKLYFWKSVPIHNGGIADYQKVVWGLNCGILSSFLDIRCMVDLLTSKKQQYIKVNSTFALISSCLK